MNAQETTAALLWLTHSWEAAPPSTAQHLAEARKAIALALLGDQSELIHEPEVPAPVGVDPTVASRIAVAVAEALTGFTPGSLQPRVFVRSLPVLTRHNPASVPRWAAGLAGLTSLGPFSDDRGFHHWVDSYEPLATLLYYMTFAHPGENFPFLLISGESNFQSNELIDLGGSTVWIHAQAFDAAAPAAYVGLRILGGQLRLDGPLASSDPFVLDPQGSVELTLDLDVTGQTGPGATRAGLPEQVTIHIAPLGVDAIATADLSLELEAGVFTLRRGDERPRYERALNAIVIPLSATPDRFNARSPVAALYELQGETAIESGAWTLPITETPVNLLSECSGAGSLALILAPGLTAAWRDLAGGPIRLNRAFIEVSPGLLAVVAPAAENRRSHHRVLLWQEPGTDRRSSIEAQFDKPHALAFLSSHDGIDAILTSATIAPTLDRPLHADGSRTVFRRPDAVFRLIRQAGGPRVEIFAAIPTGIYTSSLQVKLLSFAISNALLRTTPALALTFAGSMEANSSVPAGKLVLGFGLAGVLPILPDPYAANVTQTPPRPFTVVNLAGPFLLGRVQWTAPSDPSLSFDLTGKGDGALLESLHATDVYLHGWQPERLRMLDVSSNADLFGVGFNHDPQAALVLRDLDLVAPIDDVTAFTLPAFHWEPVYNIPAEGALPFPDKIVSDSDGGAVQMAMLRAPAASLVPVAPLDVVRELTREYNSLGDPMLMVRFTLPFGMVAFAEVQRGASGPSGPQFDALRPDFPRSNLSGGLQLTLAAPASVSPPGGRSPGLAGRARQHNNSTTGINVLKSGNVDDIFNATFSSDTTRMIPVERIDFSGYGASTFSDWRDPGVTVSGVTQVKFQAVVGRVGREVVQVRSRLYPWGAIVVRTITMERTGGGGVFRRDSGWQAASDGDYTLGPGCEVHAGVVRRLTGIRRIRDTANTYQRVYPTGAAKLTQVLFDADVEIDGVTLGANSSSRVPTRDLVGYVQVLPVGVDLTAHQLDDLLAATGPIGGPIDCELDVAQSGLHMRLSRIEVDRTTTPAGTPEFVAVARGTPELPNAGQWSFTYRGPSEPEPHRLEPNRPIPLIRADPVGAVSPPYRFADPRELHRPANPDSEYGLLFSADAQRMLIAQPQLRAGDATIHAGAPLLFADMYALGGTTALFPRPERCHPLPSGSSLRVTGRRRVRLQVPSQGLGAGVFKVAPLDLTLHQNAALTVRSRFRPDATIRLAIDSDQRPEWSCRYGPVSVVTDIEDLEGIMQVVGDMTSSAAAAPEVRDPHMVFGGPLAAVQTIINFLTDFGLPFPFHVSVTNKEYSFKTGTKYKFPPPGLDALFLDDAIKKGLGVMLELELVVGLGTETESVDDLKGRIEEHPRTRSRTVWHSHLECEAKILVKAFELGIVELFLGGASKYEFVGKSDGTSEAALYLGFAGVVEVDLVILEITGLRAYSIVSRRKNQKLELGFASQYEVEGELLKGLVTIGLSFELLLLVEVSGDFHFAGEATLALDVTLGWVASKSYEVEFEMSETLAAAAFVATTVLPIR